MEEIEQIQKWKEFIEQFYYAELLEKIRKGDKFLVVDFALLSSFDINLAELLMEQPEAVTKAAEYALSQFDVQGDVKNFAIRFRNLPQSQKIMVRDIRSSHLGKLIWMNGVVRQKSDVRPQMTTSKFECPSCNQIITVYQVDTKFKEPTKCSCGRKGKFHLIGKELVDVQSLTLEETSEELEGGEQPKRIKVFLKNDLVSPLSEKRTNPGTKIVVVGLVKEVPIILKTGGQSTRFDIMIEASYTETVQEEFIGIEIGEEDLQEIKELSEDPKLFQKMVQSIAPSIYGHELIKEALLYQLMGGVRKVRGAGAITRGDMHILLIGDPGSGKSQLLKRIASVAPKSRYVSGKGTSGAGLCVAPKSMVLTNPGGMEAIEQIVESRFSNELQLTSGIWRQDGVKDLLVQSLSEELKIQSRATKSVWKLKAPKRVFSVTLASGKSIELTSNTKLLTIRDGKVLWKKSKDISINDYVATAGCVMQGMEKIPYTVDLIASNPVVHEVKHFVSEVTGKLSRIFGTKRQACKNLQVSELSFYHNWVNSNARGNIKLKSLKKLCVAAGVDWQKHVQKVSLYNGKNHRIPTFLNEELLYCAGLITGDGDIRKSGSTYSVRLSNSRQELHKIYREFLRDEFGLMYDVQDKRPQRPESTRASSKILAEIFFALGIPESPKSNRIVLTNVLLHLPNQLIAHFIAGLYDTDGCVNQRKTKGSDCIDLTTCSESLARQLQITLLRFGIHSRLRQRPPSTGLIKGNYNKFVLEIRGIDNIRKFADNIKLRHEEKKRKLRDISRIKSVPNTNVDVIPGLAMRFGNWLRKRDMPLHRLRDNLSRQALRERISVVKRKDKEFLDIKRIAQSDIFWDKVKVISHKQPEYEFVYDLTIEDSHNFIVDGILVHNTATVVKDEFLQGYSLEAGALVLANRGICMIDELDKMTKEDRSAMHEALEQQTVSISKANIQATLTAETTVLAAANPKFGRFNPYENIAEQIDLPSTLINRFDLIFPIKDVPDEDKDKKMSQFILNLHQNPNQEEPEISTSLLRKYIAYAKQHFKPQLTEVAMEEIQTYYLKMRASGQQEGVVRSIPISARQLEGLIRLSEAVARVRLSDKVTKKDARRAINLLDYCLRQIAFDEETGTIDIDRISTGIPSSQRTKIVTIKEIIIELENKLGKTIPIEDIMRLATEKGIDESDVDSAIEKLKRSGDVYEPKRGLISRL